MLFSRNIYFIILGYVLLILLTAGLGGWLIVSSKGYVIGGLLLVCALFQIGALVKKLNDFNRRIRLFLDAVEDRENMLYFSEQNSGIEQQALYRSLNRINALLSNTKAQNRVQEYFYQSLLEEIPTGIVAWEESGQIILANNAAFTLLECHNLNTHDQVIRLLNKDDKGKHLSLSEKKMILFERSLTLLSIKDINDELNAQESESWNKLTHVLTHEIMNTIAPIISLSQTLEHLQTQNSTAVSRGLHIIRTQSERLMDFTESFRHFSYLPQPDKKLFSFTEMMNNLSELLESDFEMNRITFTLQSNPTTINICADQNQLSQAFLNLLKNAIQALEGCSDGKIAISILQTERLWIEIMDNGAGIPSEIREQVFIPFFTTKSEGTGVGLSLCRQIINHHGGHINIAESCPRKTVFQIDLPL